jgi:hypothetical protein
MTKSTQARASQLAETQNELQVALSANTDESSQRALEAEAYEKSAGRGNSARRTRKREDLQRE